MSAPAPRAVRVTARAKLNLGLAVGPRRPDGFHELATVFQSISLADTLTVTRRRAGFTLRIRHEDASSAPGAGLRARRGGGRPARRPRRDALVPAGADNLVLRAARLYAERAGFRGGAGFELVKRIPAQAGLGGGSADAAAALLAMDRLSGNGTSRARRLALGAELGSDVPFAVTGGTSLGLGRGERLTPLRLARPFRALVVVPAWRISTRDAFHQIDRKRLGLTNWNANLRFARSLGRSSVGPERAVRLGNVFEHVLGERREDFLSLRDRLKSAGATSVSLSGSGSAIFALIPLRIPSAVFGRRFQGSEPRYEVRSERTGLRLEILT